MSAAYPLHLERETGRRWVHRFMSIDRPVPPDRPRHPNDIRPHPTPKRSDGPAPKSELSESDQHEHKPNRRERKHLMEF
jgi:hypothetical protein